MEKSFLPERSVFSGLTRERLAKLKSRALRSGIWFKALRSIDRALWNLTIRVTNVVQSFRLAKALFSISLRVEEYLLKGFSCFLEDVGRPIAHKLSLFAESWGNRSARNWKSDGSFAKFLAVMHISSPGVGRL